MTLWDWSVVAVAAIVAAALSFMWFYVWLSLATQIGDAVWRWWHH